SFGILASEICIPANPVHFATAGHFFLSHNWNVVFGLTRNRACVAPDTVVQIERHAPSVIQIIALVFVVIIWIERFVPSRKMFLAHLFSGKMVSEVLRTKNVPIFVTEPMLFQIEMNLCARQWVSRAAGTQLNTGSEPCGIRRPEIVSIEALTIADPATNTPAIS